MVYIYLLKCKSDKYFVGNTTNPKFKLNKHSEDKKFE